MKFKLIWVIICYQLLSFDAAFAAPSDTEIIYIVMRNIGIKYLTSGDRKLHEKNRNKWENRLSDFVDFTTLNSRMKERIRSAVSENNKDAAIDSDTLIYLEEKAVESLVPRRLFDYTRGYLFLMDNITKLPVCSNGLKPEGDKKFGLCEQKISESEIRIKFIDASEENQALLFKKTDRWRLSDIEIVISERRLALLGRRE